MEKEEVLRIHVTTREALVLENAGGDTVVMIPFGGHATGRYFEGTVLEGGVDTQIIGRSGVHTLSARYMLRGTDREGQNCEIYIENNGNFDPGLTDVMFRTAPRIVTNSKALSFLNGEPLIGEGLPAESGVEIRIYRTV